MEIAHADLPKVTGMVFVQIRPMVMLSTRHTPTTWMLAMLAYTAVAGGYMAATVRLKERLVSCVSAEAIADCRVDVASYGDDRSVDILLSCFRQSSRHLDGRLLTIGVVGVASQYHDLQMGGGAAGWVPRLARFA